MKKGKSDNYTKKSRRLSPPILDTVEIFNLPAGAVP
jgi:hypothetical protein